MASTEDFDSINSLIEDDGCRRYEKKNEMKVLQSDVQETTKDDGDENELQEATSSTNDEWTDLLGSGSLMKKMLLEGTPDTRPHQRQKCIISYTCSLEDGTVVDCVEDYEMNLGDNDVIQGLDVAIGLMNVGEKCRLIIEPRLAYGAKGLPPKIPANATVTYDIVLQSIEDEDEPAALTIHQRKAIGNRKRERGNFWYGRAEWLLAVNCYRRALDYLDEVEGGITTPKDSDEEVTDAALQELLEDRISVYNNLAAAQIKLDLHSVALNSLQTVLRCQPNNIKALFRKAKVHKARNELELALKCLHKADEVSSNDSEIKKEISAVNDLIQRHKQIEVKLAKRMFGIAEKEENKQKPKKNTLFTIAAIGASVAIGMVGMAAYKFRFA